MKPGKKLEQIMEHVKILKFGGSSVGNSERISSVMDIIRDSAQKGPRTHVVVSAFQGMTDRLIAAATSARKGDEGYRQLLAAIRSDHEEILGTLVARNGKEARTRLGRKLDELSNILQGIFLTRELTPRTLDVVMSFGERLSAYIISEALQDRDFSAAYLDARKVLRTDSAFGQARIDFPASRDAIRSYFQEQGRTQIITGFIASTPDGETTTLGRSGSDFTASIFAAALDADVVEIWTDVDGVMAADPRKVKNAFLLKSLTYDEAMELSHFGAKVIHPATMQPALDADIPILIKNTFNPDAPGTLISREGLPTARSIKGISSIDKIALISVMGSGMVGVAGVAKRIFTALARKDINVILITQASSEHSICFAVEPRCAEAARKELQAELRLELHDKLVSDIQIEKDLSIIAIVGENMKKTPGIAGQVFRALGEEDVNIVAIAQGASELNISIVVSARDEVKALNILHATFFVEDHSIYIFIGGAGHVSRSLCRQVQSYVDRSGDSRIRPGGIMNSRKMILFPEGSGFSELPDRLAGEGKTANADQFMAAAEKSRRAVFVDCSWGEAFSPGYERLLSRGIAVVTANKTAMSADGDGFRRLKETADANHTSLYYEANVGAGLPVMSTLRKLIASGDTVQRIEALLSGTLAYIFNAVSDSFTFSEAVKEAKRLGYTESDPREDLNGLDMARKALIIARELGFELDLAQIRQESILPDEMMKAADQDAFMTALPGFDPVFAERLHKAAQKGKRLRYIAEISKTGITISLREVTSDSPFFHLRGTDNLICISSRYYSENPLVIQGPGAGGDVTASAVFSDCLAAISLMKAGCPG